MCFNCKYLDVKKKKTGACNGAVYYCKKNNCLIYDNKICSNFVKDEKREKEVIEKIEEDTNNYDNIKTPPEVLFAIFILLVILGLIMGVF